MMALITILTYLYLALEQPFIYLIVIIEFQELIQIEMMKNEF